jgi:hypothetical protein
MARGERCVLEECVERDGMRGKAGKDRRNPSRATRSQRRKAVVGGEGNEDKWDNVKVI